MPRTTITADGTYEIGCTDIMENGVSVHIPTTKAAGGTATLGGGTLSITRKPVGGDSGSATTLDSGLTTGWAYNYLAGSNTRYYAVLSGSSGASFDLIAEKVR